jgi:hypothetical protein
VDTRRPRTSGAAEEHQGVEEMARGAWSCGGGKFGWSNAGGLNRRGQDGGGVRPTEWWHWARAPCGARWPATGADAPSDADVTLTRYLHGPRSEQGTRRLPSGPA